MPRTPARTSTRTYHCQSCGQQFTGSPVRLNGSYGDVYIYCENCGRGLSVTCPDCGRDFDRRSSGWRAEIGTCYNCSHAHETWGYRAQSGGNVTFEEIGSERAFGVEIETAECDDYRSIRNQTLFGAKFDGSIGGMEFVSPPLKGDQGIAEVAKLCGIADEKGWSVDSDCGLHVHLDVSCESMQRLRRIAYAFAKTQAVWQSLTTPYRATDCCYATPIRWKPHQVFSKDVRSFGRDQSRYQWLNIAACERHGTIEVRIHEGTIDGDAICNWIKALVRFADWAADNARRKVIDPTLGDTVEQQWEAIKRIIGSDVAAYYERKRTRYLRDAANYSGRDEDDDDDNW